MPFSKCLARMLLQESSLGRHASVITFPPETVLIDVIPDYVRVYLSLFKPIRSTDLLDFD